MQVYPPAGVIFTGIGVLLLGGLFDQLNHCDNNFLRWLVLPFLLTKIHWLMSLSRSSASSDLY